MNDLIPPVMIDKSTTTTQTTAYVLDQKNRIVSTCSAWDQFAAANEGRTVFSDNIIGCSIWDFITGDITRIWLDAVLQIARYSVAGIERPYRCDSPDMKRFMRMRIIAVQTGMIRLEHEILSIEKRLVPLHIRFSANTMNSNIKQRCSICGRLNIGGWQEPHTVHADASNRINVIYAVCDDCQRFMPGAL